MGKSLIFFFIYLLFNDLFLLFNSLQRNVFKIWVYEQALK